MRPIRWFLGYLVRHPIQGAVLTGLIVSIVVGAASFPQHENVEKTLEDWLPDNAVDDQEGIDTLIEALERAQAGEIELESLSLDGFGDLGLPATYAFPEKQSGDFLLRYVGTDNSESKVYTAERKVSAAPWWHPERFLYRASEAETEELGQVLRLSYERDWQGLAGVLAFDVAVSTVYGLIVGLLLGVLNMKELQPAKQPSKLAPKRPGLPYLA
jgi:hypothetical protein